MSNWVRVKSSIDLEVLEESALAMAQSAIQNAMNEAQISRAEMARKMVRNRSIVSRILSGHHNLTIKTMARALAACNSEVRFEVVPLEWNWTIAGSCPKVERLPAGAGNTEEIDAQESSMFSVLPAPFFNLVHLNRREIGTSNYC